MHRSTPALFRNFCRPLILAAFGLSLATAARADLWSTGYYPGWEQNSAMPASAVDFSALTHIIHFSVIPNSDGSLNGGPNSINPVNSTAIISQAHAAGKKVLICVGGASTESDFLAATTSPVLPSFVSNLVNFVSTYGYDGVDIDWEPFYTADAPQYTNLVVSLRSALNALPQPKLLTVAAPAYPSFDDPSPTGEFTMFASIQSQFDQINIMTYDLSGPYGGWVTWFNSPIFDGNYHFPSTGGLIPSVDGGVKNFISKGVAPAKLGIGIAFYGDTWSAGAGTSTGGAALPRQTWTNAPSMNQIRYTDIISTYYQPSRYAWDTNAQAAYLSIDNSGSANDKFITYDDPRTCQSKVSYARNRGLGGVMIWELAQDHTAGQTDPLLQSIKQALATPGLTAIQLTNSDIQLSFTSIALGSYRVQWTADLGSGIWNTLLTTNITGLGGTIQITDPGAAANQSQRFYRVQTPQ